MPSPRYGDGLELPGSSDPPIEMTSLGEPNLLDPFLIVDQPPPPGSPAPAGLYPETGTTAPCPASPGPSPAYGGADTRGYAAPKKPVYIADTPEELHGGYPAPSPRPSRHHAEGGPWHTQQSTTIVVNQQPPVRFMSVRPGPVDMICSPDPVPTKCHNCEHNIISYIYHTSGTCTWVTCVAIAASGGPCGCCLIPFFIDTFKDAVHKCPYCHVIVGKHKKFC